MALPITDAQGTLLYIAPEGTDVSDATKIATAILTAKQVGCIQSLGSIDTTKEVTEYSCLSSNEIQKSLGSVKAGNLEISTLFNAKDAAGQAELRLMYKDNSRREFIIKLSDDGTANPTYITFQGAVSAMAMPIEKDSAVLLNFTVEMTSIPVITNASDT